MTTEWGTFSRLPVRRKMEIGVDKYEFFDLDARNYVVEVLGLKHSGAGNISLLLQYYDGLTWSTLPADYTLHGGGGIGLVGGVPLIGSWPPDAPGVNTWFSGVVEVEQFDLPTPTWAEPRGGRLSSSTGQRYAAASSLPTLWTGLRLIGDPVATFTHNLGIILREQRP